MLICWFTGVLLYTVLSCACPPVSQLLCHGAKLTHGSCLTKGDLTAWPLRPPVGLTLGMGLISWAYRMCVCRLSFEAYMLVPQCGNRVVMFVAAVLIINCKS